MRVLYATDSSIKGYRDREFNCIVKWDQPLMCGVDSYNLSKVEQVTFFQPRAGKDLIEGALVGFTPDVAIMTAYSKLFWLDVFKWIRHNKLPLVSRMEATDVAAQRSKLKSLLRDCVLKKFYRHISAFCVIGAQAQRHFNRLGVSNDRCFSSPYCIDSDLFEKQYRDSMPRRDSLRGNARIGETDIAFIFSGKLVQRKDPMIILAALSKIDAVLLERVHLIVAGDGILRASFCELATRLLGERFHYKGFLNQGELGDVYAMADCLLLPSARGFHETWGLVVNEAMQFHCSAIVSDAVGCHIDLIDSSTGYVFPAGDAGALAEKMHGIITAHCAQRERYRAATRDRILKFSNQCAVAGILEAVKHAYAKPA